MRKSMRLMIGLILLSISIGLFTLGYNRSLLLGAEEQNILMKGVWMGIPYLSILGIITILCFGIGIDFLLSLFGAPRKFLDDAESEKGNDFAFIPRGSLFALGFALAIIYGWLGYKPGGLSVLLFFLLPVVLGVIGYAIRFRVSEKW